MAKTVNDDEIPGLPNAGTLNDISAVNDVSDLFNEETDGRKIYSYIYKKLTQKNAVSKHNGEFLGIVFKTRLESNIVESSNDSIGISGVQGVPTKNITAYRIYVPEFTSKLIPDDFYDCSAEIAVMHDFVPFPDAIRLSVGDVVLIRYKNKISLSDPIGIKKMSSEPLDLRKNQDSKTSFNPFTEKKSSLLADKPNPGQQLPVPLSST